MATDPSWFNEEFYLRSKLNQLQQTEPDKNWNMESLTAAIAAAGYTPLSHFESYGLQERTSPNPMFNAHEYLNAKLKQLQTEQPGEFTTIDEVAAAIRDAGLDLWSHFQNWGWREGVNPSNAFDVNGYLEAKLVQLQTDEPDADWDLEKVKDAFAAAGVDPITHHQSWGSDEGVTPVEVPEDQKVEPDPNPVAPIYTFEVNIDDAGVVSFDGTAPGDITTTVEGDQLVFTRAGVTQEQALEGVTSIETPAGSALLMTPEQATQLSALTELTSIGSVRLSDQAGVQGEAPGTGVAFPGGTPYELSNKVSEYLLADAANRVQLAEVGAEQTLNVKGGSGNDIFSGNSGSVVGGGSATAPQGLVLDGGEGVDELRVELTESIAFPAAAPTLTGIEKVLLSAKPEGANDNVGLMLSRATGVEEIWNVESTANLTVTDVRNPVKLGIAVGDDINDGEDAPTDTGVFNGRDFAVRYGENVAAIGTQELQLHNANVNLLTITKLNWNGSEYLNASAGINTLNIAASGNNSIATLHEAAAGDASLANSVKAINVTGADGSLNLNVVPGNVETVDAGTYGGNLTVTLANDHGAATITGGAGNDTISFGVEATVTGGAGNDTFVITAPAGSGQPTKVATVTDYAATDVIDLTGVTGLNLNGAAGNRLEIHQAGQTGGGWGETGIGTTADLLVQLSGGSGSQLVLSGAYDAATTINFKVTEAQAGLSADATAVKDFLVNIKEGTTISATEGGAILSGGGGAQTLVSGAGNDIMQGGGGNDVFQFNAGFGIDVILDYGTGTDSISLGEGVSVTNAGISTLGELNTEAYGAVYQQLYTLFGGTSGANDQAITVFEQVADGQTNAIVLVGNHATAIEPGAA